MRNRVRNPRYPPYKYYGGRGITLDPRWDDYTVFLADMGERPIGKTIDRKDNSKGYGPDNCVWSTKEQQARNKRGLIQYRTVDDRLLCAAEVANYLALPYHFFYHRMVTRKRKAVEVALLAAKAPK